MAPVVAANSETAQELLAAVVPANSEAHQIDEETYMNKRKKQATSTATKSQRVERIIHDSENVHMYVRWHIKACKPTAQAECQSWLQLCAALVVIED